MIIVIIITIYITIVIFIITITIILIIVVLYLSNGSNCMGFVMILMNLSGWRGHTLLSLSES